MCKRSIAILALAPLACLGYGQASLTGAGYSENFDTLTALGESELNNIAGHWTDDSTLPGWYKTFSMDNFDSGASANAIYLTTHQAGVRGAYSVGTEFDTDRALSVFTPYTVEDAPPEFIQMEAGLRLRNDTGSVVQALTVTFTEEHWRASPQIGRPPMHTKFSYLVGGATLEDAGYTEFADLDIVGLPQGGDVDRDRNLTENQRLVQATISGITLNPGEDIWLKWTHLNTLVNLSPDSSLTAIDNLSIQAAAPVPEPATMAVLGFGALAILRRRNRGTSAKR